MGKHFGELAVIRGIIYYKLSPHEQKPFAKAISGISNFVPRTLATVRRWLPPFILGYLVYEYAENLHWQLHRKNPRDYENEVDPNPPKECKPKVEPKKCEKKKKSTDEE